MCGNAQICHGADRISHNFGSSGRRPGRYLHTGTEYVPNLEVNMKKILMVSTLLATLLASSIPAFAQRDEREREHRAVAERHEVEKDRREERGAGPYNRWHRGDRLPPEMYHRHFVVEDWRGHGLYAPPRGAIWVQSGADYILVAAATGIILNTFLYH